MSEKWFFNKLYVFLKRPKNDFFYKKIIFPKMSEMLRENFGKRTRGWVALRGMWGKRSDPEVSKNFPEVSKKAPIPKVTEEEARQILEQNQ